MKSQSPLCEVRRIAVCLLSRYLPEGRCYHDLQHTREVARAAREIGIRCQLSADELEVVQIAAWLHDVGHIWTYRDHEEASTVIARRILNAISYPEEKISLVIGCIEATRMPQSPQNLLEEVICDADLAHLSRLRFFERNRRLLQEWKSVLGTHFSCEKWAEETYCFLAGHRYHTGYGRRVMERIKRVIMFLFHPGAFMRGLLSNITSAIRS